MGALVSVKANAPAGRAEAFISNQEEETLRHFNFSSEVPRERNQLPIPSTRDKRTHASDHRPNEQDQKDPQLRTPLSLQQGRPHRARTLGAAGRTRPNGSCSAAQADYAGGAAQFAPLRARQAVLTRPERSTGPSRAKVAAGSLHWSHFLIAGLGSGFPGASPTPKTRLSPCADARIRVSSFHCRNSDNLFIHSILAAFSLLETPLAEGWIQQLRTALAPMTKR